MRFSTFLGYAIPLGTLLGLGIAYSLLRLQAQPADPAELLPPKRLELPALPAPAQGHTLEGVVLDPNNRPLADALVWARAGSIPAWTYSDREGHFVLPNLPQGPYEVSVVAWGHAPLARSLEADPQLVALRMERAYGSPPQAAQVPHATWRGRLEHSSQAQTAAQARDYSGFEVLLMPPELTRFDGPLPRRTRVRENGEFEFPQLCAGDYSVHVLPAWAAGGTWPDVLQGVGDSQGPRQLQHRGEDQGGEARLELDLGSVEVEVLGTGGEHLQGALALLRDARAPNHYWPTRTSVANAPFARWDDVPAGHYVLEVSAGSARWTKEFELQADESVRIRAPLSPDALLEPGSKVQQDPPEGIPR